MTSYRSSTKRNRSSAADPDSASSDRNARLLVSGWLPVLALEAVVLYLSSRPNLHLPGLFPDVDKVAHFTEYAALGAVLYRALRLSGAGMRASLGVVLVLIGCLGMGDEYLQSHVPGRSADLHDWAADLLGGTAGALAAFRLQRVLPAGWISRRGREA